MKITIWNKVKNPKVYVHGASDRKLQEYGNDVPVKTK
jgi:hypothetical protein